MGSARPPAAPAAPGPPLRSDGGCMLIAKVVTKEKWDRLLNGCFSDAHSFCFAEQHSSLQRGLDCLSSEF